MDKNISRGMGDTIKLTLPFILVQICQKILSKYVIFV
jgi:hypothetical protein